MQISFTPEFADRLAGKMNLVDKDHNPHGGGNDYSLEIALDEDILLTSVGWADSYYNDDGNVLEYTDEWGIGWHTAEYQTKFGKGRYTEITGNPLSEDSAVQSYKAPDPTRADLYEGTEDLLRRYKNDYWICGVTVTTIFETAWALRGLDKMLMDFVLNPELAEEILDIPFQYHLTAAEQLVRMGVDMIWTGDDMGGQEAMLISPDMWRRFFKPRMAHMFESLKAINPDIKIAYHSDGVIDPIIPDLIEIGLDILNPIQPASMNPADLGKKYGDKLCFWGTIDEQHTLPFGTPEDVKKEVETRLQTIGRQGGLIIGPTHHVQLDTPMENFDTMVKAIKETSCI
jgi:uroporphyrinogen decarboxylase